jgi:hypothetical protein
MMPFEDTMLTHLSGAFMVCSLTSGIVRNVSPW